MQGYPLSKIRWCLAVAMLAIGFGVLVVRLVLLQVVSAEELSMRAVQQREKETLIEAERGTIFDRKERILATNLEVPSLYAVPSMIDRPGRVARKLSRILGMDAETIEHLFGHGRDFVWIKRKITPDLERDIMAMNIDGVGIVPESKRFYPKRYLLGQILGFAGLDNQGLEGIELRYNDELKGKMGRVIIERDAARRTVFQKGLDYIAPARGNDLILTIDEVIQHIAERELDRVIEETEAKSGSVIVMEPYTGEVLAMVVRPVFNPNSIRRYDPSLWRNRAIADAYEPGSTFKMVTAAAALEEDLIRPLDLIFCEEGEMRMGGRLIHDHRKYGELTFAEVVQKSSNIGTVKVATKIGEERLYRYVRTFGFGELSEIDLLGETTGLIRPPALWSSYSLASVSIGQEISVTPIQLVTAYAALANGGLLMRPYIVSEIRGPEGDRLKKFSPQVRRRVIRQETSRRLTKILEGTVSEWGTAAMAAIPGFTVAGKTGTAEKLDPVTGRYSGRDFITSFVGFVPAEKPRIVILVIVDSPKGRSWGGTVAAPVFKRIAESTLHYMGAIPRAWVPQVLEEGASASRI